MAFKAVDQLLTALDLYQVETTETFPTGTIVRGMDLNLGGGEFMYVRAAAAIPAGSMVELTSALASGKLTTKAQIWQAAAALTKNLGVALVALETDEYGWIQVQGNAIVTVSGSVVVGERAFWQANGVVSSTGVNGRQALGVHAVAVHNAVIGAAAIGSGFAVYSLQRPFSQGQVT